MPAGIPSEIFGPAGALALAIAVIAGLVKLAMILWKEHLKADQDDRDQRDRAVALVEQLVPAIKDMADAWQARNKADAARRRRNDP